MLKVCVITTSFPRQEHSYRGIFIKKYVDCLCGDIDFTVLAPSDHSAATAKYEKFKIIWVPYAPSRWQKLFYADGGLPQKVKQSLFSLWGLPLYVLSMAAVSLFQAKSKDIIHVQWLQNGIFAILPKLLFRKKVVVTVHGSDFALYQKSKWGRVLGRIVISLSDAIVTVNEAFERHLREQFSHKLVRYIPYAYPSQAQEKVTREERKTILFVGNLTREKGLLDLMEAFNQVLEAGWDASLKIIGDGALRHDLELWTEKVGSKSVLLCGSMSNEQVIDEMQKADMLILPSYSEGRPTVVLEAMANGLPVIATTLPGIKEVVQDGFNGRLFSPGDRPALERILTEAITGQLPLKEYAENSRRLLMEKKMTVEHMVSAHLQLYREVFEK